MKQKERGKVNAIIVLAANQTKLQNKQKISKRLLATHQNGMKPVTYLNHLIFRLLSC